MVLVKLCMAVPLKAMLRMLGVSSASSERETRGSGSFCGAFRAAWALAFEHVGLRLSPARTQPPCLRARWEPVLDLLALLPPLPGGFVIRAAAV